MNATDPSSSLRSRRADFMKDEIGKTGLELFLNDGFDAVTVDSIAAAAGISQRTFFRYFTSKDEIVNQYYRRTHLRLLEALRARPADEGPALALKNAFLETSDAGPDARDRARKLGRVLNSAPSLRARLAGETAEQSREIADCLAQRAGLKPDDTSDAALQIRTVSVALYAVFNAAWTAWVTSDSTENPADVLAGHYEALVAGLTTPPKSQRK